MQGRRLRGGLGRGVTIGAPAGVGISEHLRQMRRAWKQTRHRVCGAVLASIEARMLQGAAGIRRQALVSLEVDVPADPGTGSAADPLTGLDVVMVDETGISRRSIDKLRTAVREAGRGG